MALASHQYRVACPPPIRVRSRTIGTLPTAGREIVAIPSYPYDGVVRKRLAEQMESSSCRGSIR